jgi:hypothetical protein
MAKQWKGLTSKFNRTHVPAEYLIWLYDNDKCFGDVKDYIIENMDVLKSEIKKTTNQYVESRAF